MFLGALVDAGVELAALEEGLAVLNLSGFRLEVDAGSDPRVHGTRVRVHCDEGPHPHRGLSDILDLLKGATALSDSVRDRASNVFERLASAEAEVHGCTVDAVHFHEVGALDAIVDVVGSVLGLQLLGISSLSCSPLPVGTGTVRCAHGELPVPVPATALLLRGRPTVPAAGPQPTGELVTPTGAALVTTLCDRFGPPPPLLLERVAYGLGTRDRGDFPNALRLWLGTKTEAEAQLVRVVQTTVDDLDPRVFGPLVGQLLGDGALDVTLAPVHGKKGRPALLVTVLCPPDCSVQDRIEQRLFRETTTLGIRWHDERRRTLPRRLRKVETAYGFIAVKEALLDGAVVTAQPEFEECLAAAEAAGVSVRFVLDAARSAAQVSEGSKADEA